MSERLVFELQAIDRATAPLKAVQQQVTRTAANINAASASMRGFAQSSALANTSTQRWAKGALQQAGFQVGDFAVQLANGTNGLQAFGQQAPQLLQIFGPVGAVIGAAVAVIAALGVVAQKSGSEVKDLGSAFGVLRAPIDGVIAGISKIGSSFGGLFGPLVNEIDTAIIAVGLFAGVMALKAVPAIFAAAGASGMFTAAMATFRAAVLASALSAGSYVTALTLMRAAVMTLGAALSAVGAILMRFLPVLLLVGLAKMIELFLRLKEGAGGFGNALKLLWDLSKAVFTGMGQYANGLLLVIKAVSAGMVAKFMGAFQMIAQNWESLVNSMISGWNGFVESVGMESLAVGQYVSEWAQAAGEAVGEWEQTSIGASKAAKEAFSNAKTGIVDAWGALKDAVAAGTEQVDIFGQTSADAADKAGGAAERASQQMTQAQENMKAIADTMRESIGGALMSMVDGTKSVKDAFRDMARSIVAKLYEVLVVQQIVNGVMGIVGKAFPALAPAISGVKAMGGPVTGGKAYLVGERGPEIVVPSRNASVVPNSQLDGGGVTVVQNINISTGVQQTVRNEIRSLMPQIADSAKAAVIDARRRGGQMKAAFG